MIVTLIGALTLAIWLYLTFARGGFWLLRERDDRTAPPEPKRWPSVLAVVPARNEADVIERSIGSLLAQDYPGAFRVILVDDQSEDGTADHARALPASPERLTVMTGAPLPHGWTGKLWAVSQGVAGAAETAPDYLWLTDADIGHAPDNLRRLVARAEGEGRVLVSLMAKLHCSGWAEQLLIPAFVFFFDMLFPFGRVNDPRSKVAAAAGGCMLIRREALEAAGGVAAIRGEIIDDCAMGWVMKTQGPIWLGLTDRAVSLRPYQGWDEIGRMVSRSAYAQLGYSPWLLAGTLAGMLITYIAPLALAVLAVAYPSPGALLGAAAYVLMVVSFVPMLHFYRAPPWLALAMPLIGGAYSWFTVQSAVEVWRGRGGQWKGRAQAKLGRAG